MAPKRARSRAPTQDAEHELVRLLAARLTREDLETLVASGASIARADLEARLPERLQARDIQRVEVRAGASREGTGHFDELDEELLVKVFAFIPPRSRVRAASGVCKAWRALRKCAELWSDLDERPSMPLQQLQGLIDWLPDKGSGVHKVTVRTVKSDHAKTATGLVAKLPSLTELTLAGPKITLSTLSAATAKSGATLTSLRLVGVKGTSATQLMASTVADAVKQMPRLQALELPVKLLEGQTVVPGIFGSYSVCNLPPAAAHPSSARSPRRAADARRSCASWSSARARSWTFATPRSAASGWAASAARCPRSRCCARIGSSSRASKPSAAPRGRRCRSCAKSRSKAHARLATTTSCLRLSWARSSAASSTPRPACSPSASTPARSA